MSCVTTGFELQPYGFFDKNPAMLLPRPTPKHNIRLGNKHAAMPDDASGCCGGGGVGGGDLRSKL